MPIQTLRLVGLFCLSAMSVCESVYCTVKCCPSFSESLGMTVLDYGGPQKTSSVPASQASRSVSSSWAALLATFHLPSPHNHRHLQPSHLSTLTKRHRHPQHTHDLIRSLCTTPCCRESEFFASSPPRPDLLRPARSAPAALSTLLPAARQSNLAVRARPMSPDPVRRSKSHTPNPRIPAPSQTRIPHPEASSPNTTM